MVRFPTLFALAVLALGAAPPGRAEEPPLLRDLVAGGALPPLAERLPALPRRDLPQREAWREGRYGGTLRTLTRAGRDARDLVMLGYARLMVWDEDFRLRPDILAEVEVDEGRVFTLHLRPGHRWSDGHPFTAEDFRFWWEDVATHPELSRSGPPRELLASGRPPVFEVLGETAVRFTWETANPHFLPALAATRPPFIYRPAHRLKAFHPRYRDPAALEAEATDAGLAGWVARFRREDSPFRFDNPERPTLQPWVLRTRIPGQRFEAERNPYFHRVDGRGRQLPYIDRVVLTRSRQALIPAQVAAGAVDLQARGLALADFALLKQAESRGAMTVRLWPIGRGAQLALYPNLNAVDPLWRRLLREPDFRRALSLAIDRGRINRAVYQDLGLPGANTVLPASPLYRPALRAAWAEHDPERAGRLLDGLGLAGRDSDGVRLTADGTRLALAVEAGDADPREVDVLELIAEDFWAVGVELLIRTTGRQNFRQRVKTGAVPLSIFYGLANGLATAAMSPAELAPTSDRQNNWPLWGRHTESGGRAGEPPDLPSAVRLLALYRDWTQAENEAARIAAWRAMLEIHAEQVFTIGLVGQVFQPVVASRRLRNLPEAFPYLYQPGAYFGRARADTFWFDG